MAQDASYNSWWGNAQERDHAEDQLQSALHAARAGKNSRLVLQQLLEVGGDERSVTDSKTGLTKYHTSTLPCPGIQRSSCTSNVSANEAFDRGVDLLRQLLIEAKRISQQRNQTAYSSPESLFRKLLCAVRERLRAVFELSTEDALSLFPSGTDAELLPALLGFLRAHSQTDRGNSTFTVVTAAGEVGSGTTLAAMGRHFAKRLPSGGSPEKDSPSIFCKYMDGGGIVSRNLYMRNRSGQLIDRRERDRMVENAVKEAASATNSDGQPTYGCIIVHMVLGSKTGGSMPTEACMDALVARYGSLVLPVVDACQGRLGEGSVRKFVDDQRVVLCTGSKFFGGPPFSGLCIMSKNMGEELEHLLAQPKVETMLRSSELKEYVSAPLMSDALPLLRSFLPQGPLNYGVLMRWTVALHGMEAYFVEVPKVHRIRLLTSWVRGVRRLIQEKDTPLIQLLDDGEHGIAEGLDGDEQSAALSTIISVYCRCNRGSPNASADCMTTDELRRVQFLMASDLASMHSHLSLIGSAKERCFIGQPVDLNPGGASSDNPTGESSAVPLNVLRIAASAPLMVRAWQEGLDVVLSEDQALLEKLELILGNFFLFQQPARL